MKPKDIFGLAVRLLGLLFLYLGLRAVTPMLDLDVFENPDKNEIINDLMPVAFNLVIAGFLLSSGFLIRLAYPETPKILERLPSQPKPTTSLQEPVQSPELTGTERTEKKLAALVEKPKEG